jgi:acetyl esterase/lipase
MDSIRASLDVVYTTRGDRELKCDIFRPATADKLPAIVIVHGGGWINGDKTRFRALAQAMATRGYVTASIEYRLAGEALFPAAIHDCFSAVRFLRKKAVDWNIDSNRIGAVGGSAGGHLVALMATAANVPQLHATGEKGDASVQWAMVMAGPCELSTGPVADRSRKMPENSNSNKWLGKTIDEDPSLYRLASPISHIDESTPPVFFLVGEHDNPQRNTAFRDQLRNRDIATALRIFRHGKHGCWNRHPWFDDIVDDIDYLADSVWKSGGNYGRQLATRQYDYAGQRIREFDNRIEVVLKTIPKNGQVEIPIWYNPIVSAAVKGTADQVDLKPLVGSWSLRLKKSIEPETVVEIATIGRPMRTNRVVSESLNGTISLPAHRANTFGKLLRYEPQPHKNTVGYWANENDWCQWHFYAEAAGTYQVRIWQGCGKGQGGSTVRVSVGDSHLTFEVEDTGHFQNFRARDIGQIEIASVGVHRLVVRPISKARNAVMDVRKIELIPIQ